MTDRTEAVARFLEDSGADEGVPPDVSHIRDLGDGTYVMARPLLFHWALIRGDFGDLIGYFDRWCYRDREGALRALASFPDRPPAGWEPEGWHRHPNTGRRRENGDPATETVTH